jgi:hypothetical protein
LIIVDFLYVFLFVLFVVSELLSEVFVRLLPQKSDIDGSFVTGPKGQQEVRVIVFAVFRTSQVL